MNIKAFRRKKPDFPRVGTSKKRVKEKWRRPKGLHGRIKKLLSYHKGASPKIGYKSPKKIRGLHTSGLKIVEIRNPNELKNVNPKKEIIKILKVGMKKKIEIVRTAVKMGIKISNLRNPEKFLESAKK